jgi:large subunit ribosomal protein L3
MELILGKKLGMSQMFDKEGKIVPVTVIEAGPCFITQIKNDKKDGYQAVQIGFEKLPPKKVKKSLKNKPYRWLREFETDISDYKVGDEINSNIFKEGDKVKVTGITKGKGFQGVVKRHGFSGGPATHGHRHVLRTPGSIGSAFPQKVFKGKKMPGRVGNSKKTISNLKIAAVDAEKNLIAVAGAVSGPNGGLLEIKST